MDLTYLLSKKGIDTQTSRVLVMRHRPQEPGLRRALPWLAADDPEAYNCYEQTQSPRAEKQLAQADYLASFIGHRPGQAIFVGLYKRKGYHKISRPNFLRIPAAKRLLGLGMKGWAGRPSGLWFDLEPMDACGELKGKLVVDWPGREISWSRWVAPDRFAIKAIHEESALIRPLPPWNELILTWAELKALPTSWAKRLSEWRGVYFILDGADGKGYVGSAYGAENLRDRWLRYVRTGHGGNKLLRERDPTASGSRYSNGSRPTRCQTRSRSVRLTGKGVFTRANLA